MKYLKLIILLVIIGQIKLFAQTDSISIKKFGFDLSTSIIPNEPGLPLSFDIFYKFKKHKIFIGINDYSYFQSNDHNLYGIQGGYQYYVKERKKGINWFIEADMQYVSFYQSGTVDVNHNLNYKPQNYNDSLMYAFDKSKTYNFLIGLGVEEKLLNCLSFSSFLGGGLNVNNVYYSFGQYRWSGLKEGNNFNTSFIINIKLNIYLSLK